MWIFLNNSFLSIVSEIDRPDDRLVRARCAGDIERVSPLASVLLTTEDDYHFRVFGPRSVVTKVIADQVSVIDHTEFKDSVRESTCTRPICASRTRPFCRASMMKWTIVCGVVSITSGSVPAASCSRSEDRRGVRRIGPEYRK
jgi:hypothetical protein